MLGLEDPIFTFDQSRNKGEQLLDMPSQQVKRSLLRTTSEAKTNVSEVRQSMNSTLKTPLDHRTNRLKSDQMLSHHFYSPKLAVNPIGGQSGYSNQMASSNISKNEIVNVAKLLDSEKKGVPWQDQLT